MSFSPANSTGAGFPLGLTGAQQATRWVGATASGAPASGTFEVGDWITTQDGSAWVCTVAGSPGSWTQLAGGGGGASLFANLMWPLVLDMGLTIVNASSAGFGANTNMNGLRFVVPQTGTITGVSYFVITQAGNVAPAILDTSATTRNVLWNPGAIAVGAAGWQSLGNPNLAVSAGDQLDIAVGFSSATVRVAYVTNANGSVGFTIPTGYLVSPDGGASLLEWQWTGTPGGMGATVLESALAAGTSCPLIVATIT